METIHVQSDQALHLEAAPAAPCACGFLWLDLLHDEFRADPGALRDIVARLTGARIFDLHLQDAANLQHPSFFDSTSEYDMLIFRKLSAPGDRSIPPLTEIDQPSSPARRGHRLQEIVTQPVTFFLFERLLVTVRSAQSRTIEQARTRLLEFKSRSGPKSPPGASEAALPRLPQRPEELLLRLLNGMVDRYLDLRQPLTDRLDRWQRELLDPRRSFNDWTALLDARIEVRRLENLCEEQHDALQEMRDKYLEETPEAQQSDAYLIRVADVIEHIHRVLNHARRLESSLETAVQLHFSATAHRTNQVVRLLTVITAVFAPLTLITGVFGMNFEHMPLLKDREGFWITMIGMTGLAAGMLLYFAINRVLSDRPLHIRRWWRGWQRRG
ncbi:MAG: magnesium transporter CorA family protein [Gemmatimonadota bacterium]